MRESDKVVKYSALMVDILLLNLEQMIFLKNVDESKLHRIVFLSYYNNLLIGILNNIGITKNLRKIVHD